MNPSAVSPEVARNQVRSDADLFADAAIGLLKEYEKKVADCRRETETLIRECHTPITSERHFDRKLLSRMLDSKRFGFSSSLPVYEKLIRKSSQWLEHSRNELSAHKLLELEIRLGNFEQELNSLEEFFDEMLKHLK